MDVAYLEVEDALWRCSEPDVVEMCRPDYDASAGARRGRRWAFGQPMWWIAYAHGMAIKESLGTGHGKVSLPAELDRFVTGREAV